jgi:CRP-like cAMP-binding protein
MEQCFTDFIERFVPLDAAARQAVLDCVTLHEHAKNTVLVKEGEVVRQFYFVVQGSARIFYNVNGRESIGWFAFDKSPVISYQSFITQQPSRNVVQLMEDSTLIKIMRSDLLTLYDTHPSLERFGRLFAEWLYCSFVDRTYAMQVLSAKERYRQLLEQQPQLLQRVPMGYIASYLGITQETLSRIRAGR